MKKVRKEKVVLVEWDDSWSTEAWRDREESIERLLKPCICFTTGIVIKQTDSRVVVAMNIETSGAMSQTMSIPRSAIRKLKTIGTFEVRG